MDGARDVDLCVGGVWGFVLVMAMGRLLGKPGSRARITCVTRMFRLVVSGGGNMRTYSRIGALFVGLLISGCAGLPEIPYDRMSAAEIKNVIILPPSVTKNPSVILASSVGQSFGLVGALVDAGLQASRDSHFKAVVEKQNFSIRDTFLDHLKEQLQMRGYMVSTVTVARPSAKFLDKYPTDASVDAYLDLVIRNYGYVSAGIGSSTPYRPQFLMQVRLVNAKTSSVLMQDSILYNPVGPGVVDTQKAVTISPAAMYEFPDFDRLEATPQTAVEGLRDAAYQSADSVSNLLK